MAAEIVKDYLLPMFEQKGKNKPGKVGVYDELSLSDMLKLQKDDLANQLKSALMQV